MKELNKAIRRHSKAGATDTASIDEIFEIVVDDAADALSSKNPFSLYMDDNDVDQNIVKAADKELKTVVGKLLSVINKWNKRTGSGETDSREEIADRID